ncbi:MAG: DegV family protein [Bacillota bacterium]|nr:DegV family protein [Bacillota bacterium]
MIKLLSDDGADISPSRLEQFDIELLPIPINDGENEYIMRKNISNEELFQGMRDGINYKTSQVTEAYILNRFEELAKEGAEVMYLTLSSGLSGTYDNACRAKEKVLESYPDAKIEVIDSLGASLGLGAAILRAALMKEAGASYEEIIADTKNQIKNQMYFFTVGDLKYLHRNGRLSKTSAVIGGLLNIMPIIWIDQADGKLKAIDKVRSKKAYFKKIKTLMNKYSKDGKFNPDQVVTIAHGQWTEMMDEAVEFLKEMGVKEENIIKEQMGCVIGAHTGSEVFTLYYSQDPGSYEMYKYL